MKNFIYFLFILFVLFLNGCTSNSDRYTFYDKMVDYPFLLDKKTGTIWEVNYYPYRHITEYKNMGCAPKDAPNKGDTTNNGRWKK